MLLYNLVTYASFPLAVGIAFHALSDSANLDPSIGAFYAAVFGVFVISLVLNFALIAAYNCALDGTSFMSKVRSVLVPVLPTEVAAAGLAVGVAYLYDRLGIAATCRSTTGTKQEAKDELDALRLMVFRAELGAEADAARIFAVARQRIDMARRSLELRRVDDEAGEPAGLAESAGSRDARSGRAHPGGDSAKPRACGRSNSAARVLEKGSARSSVHWLLRQ